MGSIDIGQVAQSLSIIELDRASYYEGHVKVAGQLKGLKPAGEGMEFELTGTQSEGSTSQSFGLPSH